MLSTKANLTMSTVLAVVAAICIGGAARDPSAGALAAVMFGGFSYYLGWIAI